MILGKFFRAIRAQFNKLANYFRRIDPLAEMQYEVDLRTEQLKAGREALEGEAGNIERRKREIAKEEAHRDELATNIRDHQQAGETDQAGEWALEWQRSVSRIERHKALLEQSEQRFANNLLKMRHAKQQIDDLRARVADDAAELKMSRVDAELARSAPALNFDTVSDLSEAVELVHNEIDQNRGVVRAATELSGQGLDTIEREQKVRRARAQEALRQFALGGPEAAPLLAPPAPASQDARAPAER